MLTPLQYVQPWAWSSILMSKGIQQLPPRLLGCLVLMAISLLAMAAPSLLSLVQLLARLGSWLYRHPSS